MSDRAPLKSGVFLGRSAGKKFREPIAKASTLGLGPTFKKGLQKNDKKVFGCFKSFSRISALFLEIYLG